MGFRVRKSFKLAPGVRMTVTPRGIGVSAGPRGAKLSVHSSGRLTQTLSLPGSGISHTQTLRHSARPPAGSAVPSKLEPTVAAGLTDAEPDRAQVGKTALDGNHSTAESARYR